MRHGLMRDIRFLCCFQEFKFVRQLATAPSEVSSDHAGGVRTGKSNERAGFFKKYSDHGSPFDFQPEDDEGEDVLEVNGVRSGNRTSFDLCTRRGINSRIKFIHSCIWKVYISP